MSQRRTRVLILSYHFPPLNVVASSRAAALAKYLPQNNFDVTVLTMGWRGAGVEEAKDYELIQLPNDVEPKWPWWIKVPGLSKIIAMSQYSQGQFEPHVRWHEKQIMSKAREIVQSGNFDLLIAMCSPHFHVKQCFELHEHFGIPYFVDFRDMWANRVMSKTYTPSSSEAAKDRYFTKYWKLWMSKAIGFSTVADAFGKRIEEVTGQSGITITNGFPETFPSRNAQNKFRISHVGNLLPWKNIDPFVEGIKLFNSKHQDFEVRFVGANDALKERITQAFSYAGIEEKLTFTPRVSSEEAKQEMVDADVLYYPPIEGFEGMYSAKVFEYLGAKRPILATPNDKDVIESLLHSTHAGVTCSTAAEVASYLETCLDGNNEITSKNEEEANQYSSRAQVGKLAKHLNNLIS